MALARNHSHHHPVSQGDMLTGSWGISRGLAMKRKCWKWRASPRRFWICVTTRSTSIKEQISVQGFTIHFNSAIKDKD
jgi:hypothetical protein